MLVSNIRPYFKKIWFATKEGGCSNDVLVFRAKKGINPNYLYYVLSDDTFFNYSTATSKGTKMPRGDKTAIMSYEVEVKNYEEQLKIASVLEVLDKKIQLNNAINNNFLLIIAKTPTKKHIPLTSVKSQNLSISKKWVIYRCLLPTMWLMVALQL